MRYAAKPNTIPLAPMWTVSAGATSHVPRPPTTATIERDDGHPRGAASAIAAPSTRNGSVLPMR